MNSLGNLCLDLFITVDPGISELLQDKITTIHWNRPPSTASSIPSMLLHRIFGKFVNDCENYKLMAANNKLVWKLSTAMSRFFNEEVDRASKFRQILLDSNINTYMTTIEGTELVMDSDVQWHSFCCAIIQVKNEIGFNSTQPHAQGISYYIHSTKSTVAACPGFRFPCILITLFGELSIIHC